MTRSALLFLGLAFSSGKSPFFLMFEKERNCATTQLEFQIANGFNVVEAHKKMRTKILGMLDLFLLSQPYI